MAQKPYLLDWNDADSYRMMNQTGVRQHICPEPSTHTASWDAILSPDGKLYFSLCSELTTGEYAKLAVYDYDTDTVREIAYLRDYIFPPERSIRDSKIHTSFAWLPDGRLVMLTHTTDKAPEHPAWMPLPYYTHPWEGYVGSSMLIYDPKTDKLENLGIPVQRETLYGGAYDPKHNMYYAIGYFRGHLYGIDLDSRHVRDFGQVTEMASYRLYTARDGNIYFSTRNGILQRINTEMQTVENLRVQLPHVREKGRNPSYISYILDGPDGGLYIAAMHDTRLSRYDYETGELTIVGDWVGAEKYCASTETKPYLGAMVFDRDGSLFYGICCTHAGEGFRVPTMFMRWDFLNGGEPEPLGIGGTPERATAQICSMLRDEKRDVLYFIDTNHADDTPDIVAVDMSKYRAAAKIPGERVRDPYIDPANTVYAKYAQESADTGAVLKDNPVRFTFGNPIPIPLWQQFENADAENSNVCSLYWNDAGDRLTVICGKEHFSEFVLDENGAILSRTAVEKPGKPSLPEFYLDRLPYYPGRQYKRTVTHAVRLSDGRTLAATSDGLLAIIQGEQIFSLGPAWINGAVCDMTAAPDGTVWGVAGDRDDVGIVFSYSDMEGLRWRGPVTFNNVEYGNYSSPNLTSIAVSPSGKAIAIGAGGRMGTVYIYR